MKVDKVIRAGEVAKLFSGHELSLLQHVHVLLAVTQPYFLISSWSHLMQSMLNNDTAMQVATLCTRYNTIILY